MGQKIVLTDPKKPNYFYEEAVKTLRSNIQFAGRNIRTILLTSCFPNEGKSDVIMQLAREFGNIGKKVLILDADIRKSSFASRYQVGQTVKGLSQYLSGQLGVAPVIYETNFQNVDMIFAGPYAPNPSELLEDAAFTELLTALRQQYDYVLIDTPPMNNMIDAAIVARQCDGAILVIESEMVSYKVAQKVKAQIEKTGCRILGAVLNKVDQQQDKYYNKYGYYYKK